MSIAPGWGGKPELKKEIKYLKEKLIERDKQHAGYEKAMKRLIDDKSKLMNTVNDLSQKLVSRRELIQAVSDLLADAFDHEVMDYDVQGVNQAHRVLDGGQPPKKTKLEE